ncbi:IGF-like family receptor 1 isoform X1 [Phyllostomus discolor]|uniref:IGF-like family receptor 1 n=1 Tax=Phyllostomus discolor TaxID=89673 RepID=A0A7E6CT26_9CHIR|nr:IGF-like family receptor 1 isoform X1 [Phyllostomus discolor]
MGNVCVKRKHRWWPLQLHSPATHLPEPQPAALWAGTQGQGEDTWLQQVGGFPAQRRLGLGAKCQRRCGGKSCGCWLPGWGPNAFSCLRHCSWPRLCHRKPPSTVAAWSTGTLTTCAVAAVCSASVRPHAPKPAPTKEPCPLKPGTPSVLSSQESSSLTVSSPPWTSEHTAPWQAFLTIALPLVLVLLVTSATILRLAQRRHSSHHHRKAVHPYSDIACSDPNISPGSLEAPEAELPNLTSQPLSRLLDELEVLEELIVLLDPEPGPGGSLACGTTRHLAARYGLPAAWSTFAYSLRPSRSPLRALIEMVVAREPSASLGQLHIHLAQLGRADALKVLSKLG